VAIFIRKSQVHNKIGKKANKQKKSERRMKKLRGRSETTVSIEEALKYGDSGKLLVTEICRVIPACRLQLLPAEK
jgi:hypothetical protein